jgi:hypothetical protein
MRFSAFPFFAHLQSKVQQIAISTSTHARKDEVVPMPKKKTRSPRGIFVKPRQMKQDLRETLNVGTAEAINALRNQSPTKSLILIPSLLATYDDNNGGQSVTKGLSRRFVAGLCTLITREALAIVGAVILRSNSTFFA